MKKKILFGTGIIAKDLSEYIGLENIEYFVDNDKEKVGGYFLSKKILSANELAEIAAQFDVIIAVGTEYIYQIACQLDYMHIDYSCLDDIPYYFIDKKRKFLSATDIIENNKLKSINRAVIWGNGTLAQEIGKMLSCDANIVNCEQISYEEVTRLLDRNKNNLHIISFPNNSVRIGKERAECIRKTILDAGKENVIDCFDQDIFENKFLNLDVKKYKNLYYGKRCFIVGNGPSLLKSDLECLYRNEEISFASNQIYKIFDQVKWRPHFYCCVDENVIRQNINEIVKVNCKEKFLFDYFHYPCNPEKKENIQYLHVKGMEYEKVSPKFSNDISKEIYMGYTVTYAMLQIACYMGFKEIYLIGVDHSNFEKHFLKDYFDKNEEHFQPIYGDKISLAYERARIYCKENKIRVYNVTRGGKLETFKRKNFDEIFI